MIGLKLHKQGTSSNDDLEMRATGHAPTQVSRERSTLWMVILVLIVLVDAGRPPRRDFTQIGTLSDSGAILRYERTELHETAVPSILKQRS